MQKIAFSCECVNLSAGESGENDSGHLNNLLFRKLSILDMGLPFQWTGVELIYILCWIESRFCDPKKQVGEYLMQLLG